MKRIISLFVFLSLCVASMAQSVQVNAPSMVSLGEKFNVTVSVSATRDVDEPQWEPGDDFQLVWGPESVGSSTSVSIVNGKSSRMVQKTYRFILLSHKKGSFNLPPVTVHVGDQVISSRAVHIEVVENGASQNNSSQSSSSGQKQDPMNREAPDVAADLQNGNVENFLRFNLSKTSVVVGEPITATLKLYARASNIVNFEDAKLPTFNGFWSQETYAPDQIEFQQERVGDKLYVTAVLREYTLIPQQTGPVVIEPAEITCVARARSQSRDIFDMLFQDEYLVRRKAVSKGYSVSVKPLPEGAPESFAGGVGVFNIVASLDADSLKTHEASSLRITVSGRGNVALAQAPKVKFPSDFETYDVKETDNVDASRLSGSKTFEYPFIPRSYGDFVIPAVEYSYYDYNAGRYVTVSTEPLKLKVFKSKSTDSRGDGHPSYNASAKGVENLGSDIYYISTRVPSFKEPQSFFALSPLFYVIALVLLLAGLILFLALKGLSARRADVVGSRKREAVKMARRRLALAGEFLAKNSPAEFYEELHRAMLGFATDKMNMDAADLSKENISAQLRTRGVEEKVADDFTGLLDACEYARYSPDQSSAAMDSLYSQALELITSIDYAMKHKTPKGPRVAAVISLLLLCGTLPLGAQNVSKATALWESANKAYAAGEWEKAFANYKKIELEGLESPDLYYNMGNAAYKAENVSQSILYYERALKLDPSYSEARHNLKFAKELTQDRIDDIPEFFLESWLNTISRLCPVDVWGILALFFFAVFVAMLLLFLLSNSANGRRWGFIVGVVMLVFVSLCFLFAFRGKEGYMKNDEAIVTAPVSFVKSSPSSDGAQDLFVLHEGTKVKLLDELPGWKNIELSDGRQGWLKAKEIEII